MLRNKTVLVTGSTSGIGYGIAEVLAKNHANVIVNGLIPPAECNTIIDTLSNMGEGKIIYQMADLICCDSIEKMMKNIEDEFNGVDILINNAGAQFVSPIESFPVEKWNNILALNLTASFHTIRLALPSMKKKGWGRIINIASAHGLVASINKAVYVAAKHGLVGLTKVTALETAEDDITCNAICPGWVLTELVQNQIEAKAKENEISIEQATQELLFEKQPSMKFVTPTNIGEMSLFLTTDAAAQITGTTISMDGGWTAR